MYILRMISDIGVVSLDRVSVKVISNSGFGSCSFLTSLSVEDKYCAWAASQYVSELLSLGGKQS